MIFRHFNIAEAEGVLLAHTLRLPNRTLKKGTRLTASDLKEIADSGITTVTGARLEAGDMDEDSAATTVAKALAGENVVLGKPSAGRCNLYARQNGLTLIDRQRIDAINLSGGAITVATLPLDTQTVDQQAVASIKVIPFAVATETVAHCVALASGEQAAIEVLPFRPHRTALIMTASSHMKTSILNSTAKVTRQRLAASGSEITLELRCHHDADAVSAALQQALASDCELILICGTSITVDPGDVIPSTIVANGGVIDHFGMPVEPGNMLLLAHCDKRKIINLPGCSRSPKLNGLDWVLARIMAGVEVTAQHIMLMGVGGLIKDIPHVRRKQMLTEPTQEPQQRVAVVILAAGSSKRMGEQNKLLATVGGIPILQRVVTAAQHSMAEAVVVVTGHQREEIETLLADDELQLVHNPDYSSGMASSLRCGLSALADNIDGALIVLGDMPFITAQQIDELIVEFNPNIERDIVAPLRNGRRGNPVLWSKRYFPIMKALKGDTGARKLLLDYAANIWDVPVNNDAIFIDIDTPEALTEVNQSLTAQTTADAP